MFVEKWLKRIFQRRTGGRDILDFTSSLFKETDHLWIIFERFAGSFLDPPSTEKEQRQWEYYSRLG